MEDSAFSDEFCRFIQTCVTSVDSAELLLQLSGQPERWFEAAALARSVGPNTTISDADLSRYVEQFQAGGLVEIGPDRRIHYRPASDIHAKHVEMLAQAYKERPVTLFRVIYALRDLKIQSFADAFKIRRK